MQINAIIKPLDISHVNNDIDKLHVDMLDLYVYESVISVIAKRKHITLLIIQIFCIII